LRLLFFFGEGDVALFGDVDAVQKLPDILVLDVADLLDERGGEGDGFDGVAFEDDFVLDVLGEGELDAGVALDSSHNLLAEEVPDVNGSVLAAWPRGEGQVDREVSVDGSHLVLVALGDADHHVLDVGADGPDDGKLLTVGEPSVDSHLVGLDHLDFKVGMTEGSLELASWAGDDDVTLVDDDGGALEGVDKVGGEDCPHD